MTDAIDHLHTVIDTFNCHKARIIYSAFFFGNVISQYNQPIFLSAMLYYVFNTANVVFLTFSYICAFLLCLGIESNLGPK